MTKVFNRPVKIVSGDNGTALDVDGVDVKTKLTALQTQADIIAAIPTTDQEDSSTIWNDGGVLKVSTAG